MSVANTALSEATFTLKPPRSWALVSQTAMALKHFKFAGERTGELANRHCFKDENSFDARLPPILPLFAWPLDESFHFLAIYRT